MPTGERVGETEELRESGRERGRWVAEGERKVTESGTERVGR